MKKIIFLLMIFVTILSCNKKTVPTEKTTVTFWHALGGPLGDALNLLIDEFNATHPDIYINAISMGKYQVLSQKLMASIQAGDQPDISQVYESWTSGLIEGNALVAIEDLIKEDPEFTEEDMNDIFDVFKQSNTINGKLWSFPFNKSVRVLYYNKDMFFLNDLDPNKPPMTWDDFRRYCKLLTKDNNNDGVIDIYGTTFAVSAWQFENLLLQAGGNILSQDNTKSEFNSNAGIEALNFLNSLLNEDKSAYLSTGFSGQNDFLAGKVAMLEGSSVSMAFMQNSGINFFIGFGPIPIKDSKRNIISGTNVAIFKNKDKKVEKAAWEFVKWFTDSKQTARWSKLTYYMPIRKSAFNEPELAERLESNPEIKSVFEQLQYATFEPQLREWFNARKYLEEQVLEKVLRQDLTPKEALKRAEDFINKELNKNKKGA